MVLVIVEPPNKCGKIRKIFGSGYTVMAPVGHIMDLDKKKMGIYLQRQGTMHLKVPRNMLTRLFAQTLNQIRLD